METKSKKKPAKKKAKARAPAKKKISTKTASVCAGCPGYCCALFRLVLSKLEDGTPDWEKTKDLYPDRRKELDWMQDHFIQVTMPETWKDFEQQGFVAFTCLWFDPDSGCCSHYDDRPLACKASMCFCGSKNIPVEKDKMKEERKVLRAMKKH